jgi:hypothetical protein
MVAVVSPGRQAGAACMCQALSPSSRHPPMMLLSALSRLSALRRYTTVRAAFTKRLSTCMRLRQVSLSRVIHWGAQASRPS